MVAAVRQGQSLRSAALDFGVSPATVLHWVRHAGSQRLDRVDWSDEKKAKYASDHSQGWELYLGRLAEFAPRAASEARE